MKKAISRVYGNQITILPANIRKEILVEDFDVLKWIYGSNTNYIKVEFLFDKDLDIPYYANQIFFEDHLMILYRKISDRNMHFPAEISKVINFNPRDNYLEWCVN